MCKKSLASKKRIKKLSIFTISVTMILLILISVIHNLMDDNLPVVCDSIYSTITQEEAENIALQETETKYGYNFEDYGHSSAAFYDDGYWRISWHREPPTCGGGIRITVDEKTKHVISVEGQE